MTITQEDELDGLKAIGRIVANTLQAMGRALEPGMTTAELDGFGRKMLQKGMPFVAYLGIDKALITVAPKNLSAQHVIEFCGGEFESETQETDKFPARKRYWLDCS